jgi:hypothetical protein
MNHFSPPAAAAAAAASGDCSAPMFNIANMLVELLLDSDSRLFSEPPPGPFLSFKKTEEEPSHPSETQAGQAVAFAAYIPREEGWDSTEVAYIAVDQACHFVWAE